MSGDKEMIQFGKKLKTARNSLFTFVKYPGVPSTNNDTEFHSKVYHAEKCSWTDEKQSGDENAFRVSYMF